MQKFGRPGERGSRAKLVKKGDKAPKMLVGCFAGVWRAFAFGETPRADGFTLRGRV